MRWTLPFLLVCLAAPLSAQTASDPIIDSLDATANWRAALALIDQGKQIPDSVDSPERDSLYARAERYARRAVALDSMDAEAHFALAYAAGRASLTMGDRERLERAAEIHKAATRAIALDPTHDGAYHVLGRWNAEIMRLSGVQRFFAKTFLGADIFNQASWDGAIGNLEKAVALAPERVYHHLDLATVYIDRERYRDARSHLERIAALPRTDVMDSTYKAEAAALLQRIADKAEPNES